jgi:hypothetical protein
VSDKSISLQPVPLSALDAFVADQPKPISRPEAIRVILMKFESDASSREHLAMGAGACL